jgi:branched-chain amino acid transport system permease protein
MNSLIAGAIYSLMALGFNLIYGTTKFFNLAHGAMAVVGGYGVYYFSKMLGWNLTSAIILGIALAGVLGWLLDRFIFLPLRRRKATNTITLVASLGAFTAIQAIVAILFTSQFQTLDKNTGTSKIYEVLGGIITETQVVILVSGLIIMGALVLLLKYTMFGKAVKAIGDDESVAKIIGINTDKIIAKVFLIGSAIAGWAGIMVGFDTGLEPTIGMNLLLKGIIASIIGGIGNIYGAVLGAFLLGFAENFGIWKISSEWKDAIAFGILIIFLIFRPQGILKK